MQGQEKMSKSDPNSAIFMEDSAAEVKTKIKKAFCPPEQVRPSLIRSIFALVILNLLSCDQCWQGFELDYWRQGTLHGSALPL